MTSPTSLAPLSDLYRLNTRLVLNCLDGLSDADATRRLTPATNNIAFLAVHLTDVRYAHPGCAPTPAARPPGARLNDRYRGASPR